MSKLKVSMSEADTSRVCFVKNENVQILSGCYGVWEEYKGQPVFVPKGNAVIVDAINCDILSGEKTLVLSFCDSGGRNMTVQFPRRDLTETGILSLAAYGVEMTKQDAKTLIWSIQNQEPGAKHHLYHTRLGFSKYGNKTVFLGGEGIGVDSEYQGNLSIKEYGSWDSWLNMIRTEVLGNTALEMMIAVGVSGVVNDFLKEDIATENVLVHLVGESSTGKSTAALLAVSCGCSPSFKGDSLVYSFADTQNALISSFESSYPAIIDEGSLARYNLTSFFYNLAMGREKKRMTKELAVSETSYFKTAVLMTSEKSLLKLCDNNSGLLVRNLEFEGVTWTTDGENSDRIKNVIQTNYGFLVPKVARSLLEMEERGEKAALLQEYWEWFERIVADAKEQGRYTPLTERGAKQMALILVGAQLASKEMGVSLNAGKILEMMEEHSLVNDPNAADIGMRAYEFIMQYINKHYRNFISVHNDVEYRECMGRIMPTRQYILPDGAISSKVALIADAEFEKILQEGGYFEKRIVLKRLKALDLLKSEKDRYLDDIVIQGGMKVKGYAIRILNVREESPRSPISENRIRELTSRWRKVKKEHVEEEHTEEYAEEEELVFDDEKEEEQDENEL